MKRNALMHMTVALSFFVFLNTSTMAYDKACDGALNAINDKIANVWLSHGEKNPVAENCATIPNYKNPGCLNLRKDEALGAEIKTYSFYSRPQEIAENGKVQIYSSKRTKKITTLLTTTYKNTKGERHITKYIFDDNCKVKKIEWFYEKDGKVEKLADVASDYCLNYKEFLKKYNFNKNDSKYPNNLEGNFALVKDEDMQKILDGFFRENKTEVKTKPVSLYALNSISDLCRGLPFVEIKTQVTTSDSVRERGNIGGASTAK